MAEEIIKKEDLKFKPNLENYEETYKNFKWEDHYGDVAWLDRENSKLNAAFNAIDKHIGTDKENKTALIWVGPEGEEKRFSFLDLHKLSNKFANLLKKYGIKKGDRVFLFMPRIPELYIAFLGIVKTGAIAGTLFQAFGPAAIKDRIGDSEAKFLVTETSLKERVYEVIKELPKLEKMIVVGETKEDEINYAESEVLSDEFEVEHTDAEDFAFMLYTSGTTGKPKGIMHAHLACLSEHLTAKWVLDLKDDDLYWCTADPGWVTGIAYQILGNWSNGITSLVYDGRFNPHNWYSVIEKYKVTVWYTAPTAIRMLMKAGDESVHKHDLSSLRHICSVGEPLNPEAIRWGLKVYKLPIHDTWWQTETGAMMIVNFLCMDIKVGAMGKPFPGIQAKVVDNKCTEVSPGTEGNLALKRGWPSMMRTIWGNKERYTKCFDNEWYITGDAARMDSDGYFWFVGRTDDVIKTAGERVGPFEVESALIEHPAIAEAGVIGKPDPERGQIIKAFVTLNPGKEASDELTEEIKKFVKKKLAGHAYPREIEYRDNLPKTRSGKIMRRVLKAQESGEDIGDVSTLQDD